MARRGEDGLHAAHADNFGAARWEKLHRALRDDVEHLCFLNPFLSRAARQAVEEEWCLEATSVAGAYAFDFPEQSLHRRALEASDEDVVFFERADGREAADGELAPFFLINGGAAVAAHALGVEEGDKVLDMCAAPGGKALVLASVMFQRYCQGHAPDRDIRGLLLCNERNRDRAEHMRRSLMGFLPEQLFDTSLAHGPHVKIASADISTPTNTVERHAPFDRILLDAPCTPDRDMLRNPDLHAGRWSAALPKVSADRQFKWLRNALWLLKEGGVLLYCSTALAHDECDGVIERLVLKTRDIFTLEVLPLEERIWEMVPGLTAESTDWGCQLLPDRSGFGPIYFSRLLLVKRLHEAVRRD